MSERDIDSRNLFCGILDAVKLLEEASGVKVKQLRITSGNWSKLTPDDQQALRERLHVIVYYDQETHT